jgi:hypothetical protein
MTRRNARLTLCAAAALLLTAHPALATKYAGEFMKIPVGARAIGMGGAFSAVTDDATAPYWNPAGMVYLPYREAMLQHAEQFGSLLNHDVGSMVYPLKGEKGKLLAIGGTLIRLGTDNIPVTPRPGGLRPASTSWTSARTTTRRRTTPARATARGIRARSCCSIRRASTRRAARTTRCCCRSPGRRARTGRSAAT